MSNFYNETHDFTLIHIPKTGGLSMRRKGLDKVRGKDTPWGNWSRPHFGVMPGRIGKFAIAYVRHPLERWISAYRMMNEGSKYPGKIDPKDYLEITLNDDIDYKKPNPYKVDVRHHTIPMTHPFNCIDKADHIFRFENYVEGWYKLASLLDVECPHIQHTNKTKGKTTPDALKELLSDKDIKRLNDFYSEDFKRFGYEGL